ncbi:MAG TPA: hypothetical protein VFV92_06550 [Candidatus Bathyarchaeia archaeon]|nr:hypothetical protein [Candidatus Bathyarchaeia archaeon]
MAKFIMTMGDKTLRLLAEEAQKRNVRVQELLRAVIVPEWVRSHLDAGVTEPALKEIDSQMRRSSAHNLRQELVLHSSGDRSKRQLANYLWSSTIKDD